MYEQEGVVFRSFNYLEWAVVSPHDAKLSLTQLLPVVNRLHFNKLLHVTI